MRAKARAIERAYSKLENELQPQPRRQRGRGRARHDRGRARDQTLGQISFVGLVALDELLARRLGARAAARRVGDTIADGGHDPVEAFEVEEMQQVLADAINRMPDRERLVLTLYYYEGLTLAEIGNVLGVTESRVCQIHTKAILQLRGRAVGTRTRDRHPSATSIPRLLRWRADGVAHRVRATVVDTSPSPSPVVSLPTSGSGHVHALRSRRRALARRPVTAVAVVVAARSAHARRADDDAAGAWLRPVDGAVVRPFDAPRSRYGAGHRGADLAAAPGTPVRAANDGVVSFAGDVAGTLHVVVAHAGGLRTSYSFLASVVGARRARRSRAGDVARHHRRHAGDGDHDGDRAALRAARRRPLRRSDAAVPPARPHQARAPRPGRRARRDRVVAGRRAARPPGLAAAPGSRPGPGVDALRTPTPTTATPTSRSSATPSTRCATSASWLGDHAGAAVDAGVDFLDATTDLASDALAGLSARGRTTRWPRCGRWLPSRRARSRARRGRAGRARPRRHRPTLRAHRRPPTAATHPPPTAPVAPRTA